MRMQTWLAALAWVSATAFADTTASEQAAKQAAVPAPEIEAPVQEEISVSLPAIGSGPNGPFGYTMGYTLGQRIATDIKDLDVGAFQEGFNTAYTGGAGKLTDAQMQQVISQFQEQRMAQVKAEREQLAADNLIKSNEFLAKNSKRKGVKKTPTGLQYEVLKKGTGPSPLPTDMVTAHYHGTFPDNTVFDSSRDGEPAQFPLNRVIAGWTEGVQLMNKGAKFKFFIPPQLGYGERGAGDSIGPNQALVFEVELIDFAAEPQEVPAGEAE
ncbi:MAG: FKBP-type peptidyl-prolyl cis-trans isomerase [Pseudomonadota bacterium]